MNRSIRIIGLVVGIIVLIGLITAIYLYMSVPPLPEQLPSTTMAVTITEPAAGVVLLQGGPYTVRAEVVGPAEVAGVELWANGRLVSVAEADPTGGYSYRVKWNWTITTPGQQTLFARAFDLQGQVVVSSPVRLTALQSDLGVEMSTHQVEEGETLTTIAAEAGVSVDDLLDYNNIPEPEGQLEEGILVYIPLGTIGEIPAVQSEPPNDQQAPEPEKSDISDAPEIGNPYIFWLRGLISSSNSAPAAPILGVEPAGCYANLFIEDQSDNEQGFLIYRYHGNSGQWAVIAMVGTQPGQGTFLFPDETSLPLDGTSYMVEAFNSQGKAASVPIRVQPEDSANCDQANWEGIPIVNGILALSPVYQNVYLYLSFGDGQFQRVPEGKDQFLPILENGYDLKPFLEQVDPIGIDDQTRVAYEVWGWQNGSLTRIGAGGVVEAVSGDRPIPTGSGKLEISYLGFFSDISMGTDEANIRPEPWEFGWYGQNLSELDGRVQVSLSPFPASSELNPPGLIAETEIGPGLFEIDFSQILDVEPVSEGEEALPEDAPATLSDNPGGVGLYPGALPEPDSSTPSEDQPSVQVGQLQANPVSAEYLASQPIDMYIRVVPLQDGKVAGQPTNTVIAHYIPPDPNAEEFEFVAPMHVEPIYKTEIVKFIPPDFADPNRWGCVVVTGHDDEILIPGTDISNIFRKKYPIGREICPPSYKGGNSPTFESVVSDLFNGFKSLFNAVVGLYNDLKADLINLALEFLDCGEKLESACKFALETAVNYGLAAVGLPPSLPDFDQFANAAKGEMVDVMVEEAAARSPVPCPEICKEKLREAAESTVDTMLEEMTKAPVAPGCVSEEEAHAHGSEPWCPPPGIIVKPAPGAANQPASAVIEVSLLPGATIPADYPECQVLASIQVSKFFEAQTWTGVAGWLKYPIEAQTVTMNPYYGEGFKVIDVRPGEPQSFTVVFDNPTVGYYLPWTLDMYRTSQIAPEWKKDWFAVIHDADSVISTNGIPYDPTGYFTETSKCVVPDQLPFTMP